MPPCVRIECGVCYSRLSKLKDLNQKRVVWDAFWWYATGPRISDKVIALVQDGGQNWGVTGVMIDHLMSIRRSNQQISTVDIPKARGATDEKLRFKLIMGCSSSFRTVSRSMARRS